MYKIPKSLFLLILLGGQAQAETPSQALDRKQAVLTSQLNFAERLQDTHGRYRVIRDLYVSGSNGILPQANELFTATTKWLNAWATGLAERTQGDWLASAGSDNLRTLTQQQAIQLQDLKIKYNRLLATARQGRSLAAELPRLNMEEFKEEKARGQGTDIFIDAYDSHVKLFNQQLDTLTKILEETENQLTGGAEANLIEKLQTVSESIDANMQMLTSIYAMYFPELDAQIAVAETLLATQSALEPIVGSAAQLYQSGLQLGAKADYLGAEAALDELKLYREQGFTAVSGPNFSQDRVQQVKALVDLQIDDLSNNLELKVAAKGGRAPAIRAYIRRYASQGNTTPLAYCRRTQGKLSNFRHYFDCNLFRKNVAPFMNKLDELDIGVLEEIVRNLRLVYQGPLSMGAGS